MSKDKPTSTPSTKSVIEKPAYSKCKNRPIRIPKAIDIIPIANMVSSLSCILFHFAYKHTLTLAFTVKIKLPTCTEFLSDQPSYLLLNTEIHGLPKCFFSSLLVLLQSLNLPWLYRMKGRSREWDF